MTIINNHGNDNQINDVYDKISLLNNRNKLAKGYYHEKIKELYNEDKMKVHQYYYNKILNQIGNKVDLHGTTREFIELYLMDILNNKFTKYKSVQLVTGKGSGRLKNKTLNMLKMFKLRYKMINYGCYETYKN
jgi:DNA-nicking Smr family endonuclease